MDDLRTILKELTEKEYTNIETYFNSKEDLIIFCEGSDGVFTLTCMVTGRYDTSRFIDGKNGEDDTETFKHDIDGHEVRKEILKIGV